jgi:hypothetical protein
MRNLNTNRAYRDFRRKRAELRQRNAKLSGIVLAETLTRYSEKGQAYVDTLKAIIKKNELYIADDAYLRDEQTVLMVSAEDPDDKISDHQQSWGYEDGPSKGPGPCSAGGR